MVGFGNKSKRFGLSQVAYGSRLLQRLLLKAELENSSILTL
jgi:hypothetical protein